MGTSQPERLAATRLRIHSLTLLERAREAQELSQQVAQARYLCSLAVRSQHRHHDSIVPPNQAPGRWR